MQKRVSLKQAALAGTIYAIVMSCWVYFVRDKALDEIPLRFAVYFIAFSLGYYLLMNLFHRMSNRRD